MKDLIVLLGEPNTTVAVVGDGSKTRRAAQEWSYGVVAKTS